MRYLYANKQRIAVTMLFILSCNWFLPSVANALTSGPAQPETQAFQPASVSNMVDLQSGGFNYNIPLLDIDGYPINLSYTSGTGMDDEASWVGLGWSLNPGAINRQVRGMPDDFLGDTVETDNYMKPQVTVGGKAQFKYEAKGISLGGSLSVGLFSNNYTGIGAEFGANAGLSFGLTSGGPLTAQLGLGVLASTQSGATLTPSANFSINEKVNDNLSVSAGVSASLGYNSRSGLKGLTLGSSFGASEVKKYSVYDRATNQQEVKQDNNDQDLSGEGETYDAAGTTITYNTEPINPTIQVPHSSTYDSFSINLGLTAYAQFPSVGATGYRSVNKVANPVTIKPGYGFLYAEQGKNDPNAVMDFIREKDNIIVQSIPNLALPIHTPDVWSYTSQTGSGQFRLYRGGSGVFFDNEADDVSKMNTDGFDAGAGLYFHGGFTKFDQTTTNSTHKWKTNNNYLAKGDFQDSNTYPNMQNVYFRITGEKGAADSDMNAQAYGTQTLAVTTAGINANATYQTSSTAQPLSAQQLQKTHRRPNRTMISYLTAREAAIEGLDKRLKDYGFNSDTTNHYSATPAVLNTYSRVDAYHKTHHISEMTVTDDGGKRSVYGIPVYNLSQDEYTFAVGSTGRSGSVYSPDGLVPVPANPAMNNLGVDNYYQKDHKGGYATSYLLTAILSPDYVDRTGDGITDDDQGTAIKFNYSKSKTFRWRTPYKTNKATINKGLLADPDDDKGSIVYGQKEIWYVHSIETKTKIAYFITADRNDALGVTDWQTGAMDATSKQKYLKQIRLYSKADMTRPIKVVKFQYDYSLCQNVPNNLTPQSGKLTLTKVWFEYGNTDKGKYHPYSFGYSVATKDSASIHYNYMSTDRWGIYKRASENTNGLMNDQYPYSDQDTSEINRNSCLWHLNKISLPTGGQINVNYESGDYAYVQNKRAMAMSSIESLISSPSSADNTSLLLNKAHGVRLNIGTSITPPTGADQTAWFKNNFLNGSDYLYVKLYTKVSTDNEPPQGVDYEFIPCYAHISSVTVSGGKANVMFTDVQVGGLTQNPVIVAAWQRLKNEYPRYAYPGYDNRIQSQSNAVDAAISAIINALGTLSELTKNFYQKAQSKNYAAQVNLTQSFVRLVKLDGHKMGGSPRVKRITINDAWGSMSNSSAVTGQYGQAYTYTTTEAGKTISSGVASYEPYIGNDENPLKQPVPYTENISGGLTNYYNIEEPFGESLFPAPGITYSRVTVNDLDQTGTPSTKTGSVVNEFYTAKDFPVKVDVIPIASHTYTPATHYSLTSSNSVSQMIASQGYKIEVNDMQGKPKSEYVYDQSGNVISSVVYNYKVNSNTGSLDNRVNVIGQNGVVTPNSVIGQEVEFFTDFREQISNNEGKTINIGADIFPIGFIPFPFVLPHNPLNSNNETKLFRSACAVKFIQTFGILDNVVKTQNGSTITTQNIAYDALTGEAMVTKTQNEFNRSIYSVNMPAYWAYKGMGAAYQNLGIYLYGLTTNAYGEISSTYASFLHGGDEIRDYVGTRYWVIENPASSGTGTSVKLIADNGTIKKNYSSVVPMKLVRSGLRNMLTASTCNVVCLNNPLVTNNSVTTLQLRQNTDLTSLKVINANVTTYDESWAGQPNCPHTVAPSPTVNSSFNSTVYQGTNVSRLDTVYAYAGGLIRTPSGRDSLNDNACWEAALLRCGIWVGGTPADDGSKTTTVTGLNQCLSVDSTKTYYIGYSGDNEIDIYIDGKLADTTSDYFHWYVHPIYLTAGSHELHAIFTNRGGPASAGIEIYNNPLAQLENPNITTADLKIVFSTQNLIGSTTSQTFVTSAGVTQYHYKNPDGSAADPCTPANQRIPGVVNPYTRGFLGNWRPYQTKVYQQNRYDMPLNSTAKMGVDVKNAGYINNFYSYWTYGTGGWVANTVAAKWVNANTVTLFDKYGQQLENKDALGRYSAAKFDFNGELPSAVASNAMNREIYAASFEDNKFTFGADIPDSCDQREFINTSNNYRIARYADSTISHSGNYSVLLPSTGLVMQTIAHSTEHKTLAYMSIDSSYQYVDRSNIGLYANGFEPVPGKQYIFNAWVYDGSTLNDKTVPLTLTYNSTNVPLKCKAVVEGWKLLEGAINIGAVSPGTAVAIAIKPVSGHTVNIDDIRMFPFDSQIKTYAYDDKTMRLMAELDENGFATFYEYDDEGLLIRVKKETEKGVMTIKESRSSYKKITQ